MAMIEATPGKPTIKQGVNTLGDITGMIDLSGPEANSSLAISFSTAAILDITNKMLGEEITTIDDTVIDLVGEITNIITGNAKRLYSEQGMDFNLTLPSTHVGNDLPLNHSVSGDILVLPFTIDAGEFFLEFCFS